MKFIQTNWEWFVGRAHGIYAKAWLAVLSFTESCIFIIPPDPLLAAIVLAGAGTERGSLWLYYGLFTATASIVGAVFGYILGAFFFDIIGAPLVAFYGWEAELQTAQELFNRDALIVMATAAFTPIPFKVFVLAAGFLKVNPVLFLLGSVAGRSARYLAIAYGVHRFGWETLAFMRRYSIPAAIISALLLAAYLVRHLLA